MKKVYIHPVESAPTEQQETGAARDQTGTHSIRVRRILADAAAKGSGRILDKAREIIERQLNRLAERSASELMTPAEGKLLMNLMSSYAIMEKGTQVQISALDLSGYSDTQLEAVEREARALVASVGTRPGTDK